MIEGKIINRNKNEKEYIEFIKEALKKEVQRKNYDEKTYVSPIFKKLTEEEINAIHQQGMITPKEIVQEWEDFDLCTPGNSGFNKRCHDFKNCHECLIDYANQKDAWYSYYNIDEDMKNTDSNFLGEEYINEIEEYKKLVRVKNNE